MGFVLKHADDPKGENFIREYVQHTNSFMELTGESVSGKGDIHRAIRHLGSTISRLLDMKQTAELTDAIGDLEEIYTYMVHVCRRDRLTVVSEKPRYPERNQ